MEGKSNGIFAAVVTPVDKDGVIDVQRFHRHAQWLLRHGCHGLGIFGTTSETQAFSVPERQSALDRYLAAGLPPDRIMLGVGCCATSDTVALIRHALGLGIARVLALPPFFYKNNPDEGLVRAFAEVVEKIGDERLQLFLYHFPQVSGVPITHGVIGQLLRRFPATLKGIKDSSGDGEHTLGLISAFPSLAVFAGADQHLLDVLKAGGAGTISAAGNINCLASRKVFDSFAKGDHASATGAMKLVSEVRNTLQRYPLIPAIKHVIAEGTGDRVWQAVRPPLLELDQDRRKQLMAELGAIGYLYDADHP